MCRANAIRGVRPNCSRATTSRGASSAKSGGRGSCTAVYLDIAWIKDRIPGADHIKKKLPSMYHHCGTCGHRHHAGADGSGADDALRWARAGGRRFANVVRAGIRRGECAAGLHGANRLGGNSLSDLLVFGKRAGEFAAAFAKERGEVSLDENQVNAAAATALAPLERQNALPNGEGPYQIQYALQDMMQDLVGIVRIESEMQRAAGNIQDLRKRAERVVALGNREYNPGWHTALDLDNLLTVSEAITLAGIERKESRGAHFREDFPDKADNFGKVNIVVRKNADGTMSVKQVPRIEPTAEHKQIIDEMK